MSDYVRERHLVVGQVIAAMDASLLERTHCFFGGGTRLVLELDEYRESQDVDFLCSDLAGYRILRAGISERSLGALFRKANRGVTLMRDVRADQYGIRTVLQIGDQPVKFEIILEARIGLAGARVRNIPVPVLDRVSCFAEKWLANADRWNDISVMSRDAIDLAFMLRAWTQTEAQAGAALAAKAYGSAIGRAARSAAAKLLGNTAYRKQCAANLAIRNTKALNLGLKKLQKLATDLR